MKKSNFFWVAALAGALVGCSNDERMLQETANAVEDCQAEQAAKAVTFGAYVSRSTSRSGMTGELTTSEYDTNLQTEGFGVFGYYTDQHDYDPLVSGPNFMYNQQVAYNASASKWTYSPLKYWPNEYGSEAESMDIDKLSFFAYAPYVDVNVTTGKVTGNAEFGITAVSRNSGAGDPLVRYISTFDLANQVDLCWGTAHSESRNWKTVNGTNQTLTAGLPFLDVEHPALIDQKLRFNFLHALAALNVQIDVDPDVTIHDETTQLAAETKVYVRSVSFTGFAQKGALNLNNEEVNVARWMDYNGQGEIGCDNCSSEPAGAVTVYDGRRNGKEGQYAATNEKNLWLNKTIISDNGNTQEGVTCEQKNLFNTSALEESGVSGDELMEAPIYVIPTGEPMTVTINYDVETADPLLACTLSDGVTLGSSVSNRITKEVSFGSVPFVQAGKKYKLLLHLGLNSVKFDAAVSDWTDSEASADSWHPISELDSGEDTPSKPKATTTTAPAAVSSLTYNEAAQALVTAGTSGEGTVQYALGSASAPTGTFSTTIPTATNAGTYYVWYKVVGDADHSDSDPVRLTVTIAKAPATLTLATGDLSFSGSEKANATKTKSITDKKGDKSISVSSADATKCTASISGNTITVKRVSTDAFSNVVITVSLVGDNNHNNATATFKVSAEKCPVAMSTGLSISNWSTNPENNIDVTEQP